MAPNSTLARTLDGQFVVVERIDSEAFVGVATVTPDGTVTIHRGIQGRPAVFPLEQVAKYLVVGAGTTLVDVNTDLTPVAAARPFMDAAA